jgi:hypothetical protein
MPEQDEYPFWSYEDLGLLIAAILPALLAGSLMVWVSHAKSKGVQTLIFQVALLAVLLGVLWVLVSWRYERPFWRSLGWFYPVQGLWWCVLAGPVLAIGCSALGAALHAPDADPLKNLITGRAALAVVMLFAVVLGPIYEELFFRGFLYPLLAKSMGPAAGIVLSAAPFALLHGAEYEWAWQQITIVGIAGLALGFARYKTGSTAASTALHACFNLTLFVGLLAARGV